MTGSLLQEKINYSQNISHIVKTQKPKKILVVRNDKLGDFVLSLPTFALLKKYQPDCQIHAFVPEYTRDIALQSCWIDKVITDPGANASVSVQLNTLKKIKAQKYDVVISLYSTSRVGFFAFFSGIKYRLAPATKFAQIFYNHRLTQRRSKSLKPEYAYNLDLAVKYLNDINISVNEFTIPPYIKLNSEKINIIRNIFLKKHQLNILSKLIFVHPGSGGSATNLNLQQYTKLITSLNINNNYTIVITAGPDEIEFANKISHQISDTPHIVYPSIDGLLNFINIIQLCDLFISSSTGPLHIAGALNKPTAAFYQRRRSATPLRWQTLNTQDKRLAFTPPENEDESDLQKIDINAAANEINAKFLLN